MWLYQKDVEKLKNQVARNLKSSAQSYYDIGIKVFHKARIGSWVDFQPAIGNLAISIELLLKAVIARKAIRMLYSNLPAEAQLLLCYPEVLSKEHNSTSYLNDMKCFAYKAIELDKAITLFHHLFPELKQEYKQFFNSLATIRNISVHASVPGFQRYELDRIAYFATRLFASVSELDGYFSFKVENETNQFLKLYTDAQIKKVNAALDEARAVVKQGKLSEPNPPSEDWETIDETCPVCSNTGSYSGETEDNSDEDGLHLIFQCESFSCEACGLKLDDYEELILANMETYLDRDDENDIEQWVYENGPFDHDEMW